MDASVVVWWTIDSLRRDACSVYGGEAQTDTLRALAERGESYDCRAEATWTLPSVTSILTGVSPAKHGVQGEDDRMQPGTATLPQFFRNHGWETRAVVANPWFSRRKGLDTGFDRFYNITEDGSLLDQVSIRSLVDHALHFRDRTGGLTLDVDKHPTEPLIADFASKWLRDARKPLFLMVHTQGAHSPYHSPAAWNSHSPREGADPRRAQYLNLVEFVDAQLGRFVDCLPEDALLVVTADHGESLGELGQWGHKNPDNDILYDVPLLIDGASSPFSNPVSHRDVHAWLRDRIAPTNDEDERPEALQEQLEALGYKDGDHSA